MRPRLGRCANSAGFSDGRECRAFPANNLLFSCVCLYGSLLVVPCGIQPWLLSISGHALKPRDDLGPVVLPDLVGAVILLEALGIVPVGLLATRPPFLDSHWPDALARLVADGIRHFLRRKNHVPAGRCPMTGI